MSENTIRYKKIKGKKRALCDYMGECMNLAYREVYPFLLKKHKNKGWSYLCKKHFKQEQEKYKKKLPYSSID